MATGFQFKQMSMADVQAAQRKDANLRYQAAARCYYRRAKWMQFCGSSLALILALAAPIVFYMAPAYGPLLGAIAGAWIFISRILLTPLRDKSRAKGAMAQEMFDCAVLGLSWNGSLGKPISSEEIRNASKGAEPFTAVRDWYAANQKTTWPFSVLICQRSNAVWARRQHQNYAWVLVGSAVVWFVFGIIIALVGNATLAGYLTTIALPSLPALLDASELARAHFDAAKSRELLEETIGSLFDVPPGSEEPLREIQDAIFRLRRSAPLVPEWFYKLVAPTFEEDMSYAAQHLGTEADDGVDS